MSTLSSPCRVYWSARASEVLNFSTSHKCNCCGDRECTPRNAQTVGKTKHSTRQRSHCYVFGWSTYRSGFVICTLLAVARAMRAWPGTFILDGQILLRGSWTYISAPNQWRMDGRTENCLGSPGRNLSRHVVHYVVYLVAGTVP